MEPVNKQSPNGTTILVLGIIGFFCFITGIIAWVMGHSELKLYPYDSKVRAGWICGMVSSIIAGVVIVIYIIGIIFFFTFFTKILPHIK